MVRAHLLPGAALGHAGLLLGGVLMLAACSPDASPSAWPDSPSAPTGWTSIGAIRGGEGSPVSRLRFAAQAVAVHTACHGSGTVFVSVDWPGVSEATGPAEISMAVFACGGTAQDPHVSRVELPPAPAGEADVKVFVVEGPGSLAPSSYGVSIEERQP